jgi:hypothetical protein
LTKRIYRNGFIAGEAVMSDRKSFAARAVPMAFSAITLRRYDSQLVHVTLRLALTRGLRFFLKLVAVRVK